MEEKFSETIDWSWETTSWGSYTAHREGTCFAAGKTFWGCAPYVLLHTTSQETVKKKALN